MPNWDQEYVSTPGGFFGWGDRVGQSITGTVVDFHPTGGNDFDGNACPLVMVELTEPAWTHSSQKGWEEIPAGEIAKMTCGIASLNEVVRMMKPGPGDLVNFVLAELKPTTKGSPAKVIKGRIARGQGNPQMSAPPPQQQAGPNFGGGAPAQQGPAFGSQPGTGAPGPNFGSAPAQQQAGPGFAAPGGFAAPPADDEPPF